jgi:hypothetical protein
MQLIPQWKLFWRRYSTWLALAIPVLMALREALPELKEVIPIGAYKYISGGLGFAVVVVMNIKQQSVSGGDDEIR